jgi:lantibiotic modifying enzyme
MMADSGAPPLEEVIVADAFAWVASVGVETDGGRLWCEGDVPYDDLYCGTAGVLLGCAEAVDAGFDTRETATAARDRLVHLSGHPELAVLGGGDGLFDGWSGVAVALRAWAQVADDGEAGHAADVVREAVAGRVLDEPTTDPARYTDVISGDAGMLLAMLPATSDRSLAAVEVLADRLVAVAEPAPDGPDRGLQWRMLSSWKSLMPGFSHGTAGVAYALTQASQALGREDLFDVAVRGAEALLVIGHRSTPWAIPSALPVGDRGEQIAFGWCHGAAGTSRLFTLLDAVTPDPRWSRAVAACLDALRASRLPERLYPGYWDNLSRCCGTASVGQVLLDHYQTTGEHEMLAWAGVLADDVLGRAVRVGPGLAWSNTEYTATPPDLPPEPGFMQGAVGIAAWLARLAALRRSGPDAVPPRDHPWV